MFYIHLGKPYYLYNLRVVGYLKTQRFHSPVDYPVGYNKANRAAFQSESKQNKLQLEVTDEKPNQIE